MNKTTRTYLILIGMGLASGILGGLLGIGGGSLVVPGLMFFLAFSQQKAHATSLLAALILSVAAVTIYALNGAMDLVLAVQIAAGAVIGALIGGRLAVGLRGKSLGRMFGLFLLIVAIAMFLNGYAPGRVHGPESWKLGGQLAPMIVIATGILTGLLSAILGIGGGMVMIPAMVILLGVPQKVAQGVALATVIPTAFVGVLIHRSVGNVKLRVGSIVGLGAIAGAAIGGSIALRQSDDVLRMVFGVFLALVAFLMATKKRA